MPANTVWVVRAGRGGKHALLFEEWGLVAIGLDGVDEDASAWAREELVARTVALLGEPVERAHSYASMLYRLIYEMQTGDVVVTPDGASAELIVGEITGEYRYLCEPPARGLEHTRPVSWKGRLPWKALPVQVRRSIGAPMAVFKPAAQEAVLKSVTSSSR